MADHPHPEQPTNRTDQGKILVVGMNADGSEGLYPVLVARILSADLLVGGRRHLSYFPHFSGKTIAITSNLDELVEQLHAALAAKQRVAVLASGDPMYYGIGASLRRSFPAERLEIVPAPTAFQLAFAALVEPWHDACLLSAHGRSLEDIVTQIAAAPKVALLTDSQQTPSVIAEALLAVGLSDDTPCAVCENLGGPEQRIVQSNLVQVAAESFAALNVFIVWNQAATRENQSLPTTIAPSLDLARAPGLPDEAFSTTGGLLTRREIRLLTLAELALQAGEVMWDIGAGSGSVSIEAARAQPRARVYAVEKRAALFHHMQDNMRRFPAPNLHAGEGTAPDACHAWPDPHAVFIGGSGGKLPEIVQMIQQRLHVGGRLVINLVTLEHLQLVRELLPDVRVVQVQVNRGVPIMEMLRLEACNPIFMVTWRKD